VRRSGQRAPRLTELVGERVHGLQHLRQLCEELSHALDELAMALLELSG
jgi:hypothetical protein